MLCNVLVRTIVLHITLCRPLGAVPDHVVEVTSDGSIRPHVAQLDSSIVRSHPPELVKPTLHFQIKDRALYKHSQNLLEANPELDSDENGEVNPAPSGPDADADAGNPDANAESNAVPATSDSNANAEKNDERPIPDHEANNPVPPRPDPAMAAEARGVAPAASDSDANAEGTHAEDPVPVRDDVYDDPEDGHERISCGGHTALKCRLCTVLDPVTNLEIPDKGPEWCHGDCTYFDGECHEVTQHTRGRERDAYREGVSTTKHIPDILNPNITEHDHKVMDFAAERAIEERDYEAKMKLGTLQKQEEKNGDTWQKFSYITIVTTATILFLCAILSSCLLFHYAMNGAKYHQFTDIQNASAEAVPQYGEDPSQHY